MKIVAYSLGAVLVLAAKASPTPDASPAGALLARVSAEMGVRALEEAGFTQWSFAGTYDESVERGGFEPEPPAPVKDTFAVDLRGPGAGWDSEGLRGDGTVRWRRFVYPSPDVLRARRDPDEVRRADAVRPPTRPSSSAPRGRSRRRCCARRSDVRTPSACCLRSGAAARRAVGSRTRPRRETRSSWSSTAATA